MSRQRYSAGGPTPGSPADLQPDADPESVARAIVLRKLSAAPRTRAQLMSDLLTRGVPEGVCVAVLDRFEEVHLIDDAEYARMWVASRQRTRGTARSVLRQELRSKGVPAELIEDALADVGTEDELSSARMIVGRKWHSVAGLERTARTRRLLGALQRRGHSSAVAMAVIREFEMQFVEDQGLLEE